MDDLRVAPKPGTLRQLVCTRCGLSNSDPSWQLVKDEWAHSCPIEEKFEFEEDPTPVTEEVPREKWSPKR